MYKSRIQKWKLDKNNKLGDMLFLRHKNEERRAIQKSTIFNINGEPVDWNDVQRYFKRRKEGEELLAASRYAMPSTPPHIEYRTPSPPLSHPQYAPSPRSLAAPQDTAIPEQLFYNINVYLDGSFRSGNWVPDLYGILTSLKAEANTRRHSDQEFRDYTMMAANLVERSLFAEARRVLSLASGVVVDVIRRRDPRSLHILFDTIVSLLGIERVEIVVMFQKYFADLASTLVPVGHPWGEIFRLLGTINITQLAAVSIQSWKCFLNVYETNLGRYNQDRVYCYTQYLRQSIGLVDAERLLRHLLADCGRMRGMTAFMTMGVMYSLVINLIQQQKYVDAEKLAFDLLTRAEASPVRDAMKGRALELMAGTQYLQGKKTLAETNMRSSILHEDVFLSGKGCTSIRLRIVLESWLRDLNRETDADEVKAEIDQLIGEDEIDREGLGCES